MAREAFFAINCSRYSERIIDIVKLFDELGWKCYDKQKRVVYLPLGDDDDFDWQEDSLSEQELESVLNTKQDNLEQIGINLYYKDSGVGLIILAKSTREIMKKLRYLESVRLSN